MHTVMLTAVPFHSYSSGPLRRKKRKSDSYASPTQRRAHQLHHSHFEFPRKRIKRGRRRGRRKRPVEAVLFGYRVEFVRTVIMLLRSSLSEEKMVSEAESLIVRRYT